MNSDKMSKNIKMFFIDHHTSIAITKCHHDATNDSTLSILKCMHIPKRTFETSYSKEMHITLFF